MRLYVLVQYEITELFAPDFIYGYTIFAPVGSIPPPPPQARDKDKLFYVLYCVLLKLIMLNQILRKFRME
jgi:hypothetical protein